MSHTLPLLQMLAEGKPLTARQMAERAGLTIEQTYDAMQFLRKRKSIRAMDNPYRLTDEGSRWLKERLDRAARLAAKTGTRKRPVEPAEPIPPTEDDEPDLHFTHKVVRASNERDSIVESAFESRPALAQVWRMQA